MYATGWLGWLATQIEITKDCEMCQKIEDCFHYIPTASKLKITSGIILLIAMVTQMGQDSIITAMIQVMQMALLMKMVQIMNDIRKDSRISTDLLSFQLLEMKRMSFNSSTRLGTVIRFHGDLLRKFERFYRVPIVFHLFLGILGC